MTLLRVVVVSLILTLSLVKAAELPDLIDRNIFFGNADRVVGRVSPDGSTLSWLAPSQDVGLLNVWVAPVNDPESSKMVTNSTLRPIRSYYWAGDSQHVLYALDVGGNENDHVYRTNTATAETIDLTPVPDGVKCSIHTYNYALPDTLLISMNDRDSSWYDLVQVDLFSQDGSSQKIMENLGNFSYFMVDELNQVRGASRSNPDGSDTYYLYEEVTNTTDNNNTTADPWTEFFTVSHEDAMTTFVYAIVGNTLYMIDTRDRDLAAFVAIDLLTGDKTILGESTKADVASVTFHPLTKEPLAFTVNYLKPTEFLLANDEADFATISPQAAAYAEFVAAVKDEWGMDSDYELLVTTPDDSFAIVVGDGPTKPLEYHLYDRINNAWTYLFTARPDLNATLLQPMHTLEIPSRDGLILPSYLTLPGGTDLDEDGIPDNGEGPLPMVLKVHGGPWSRDEYGYSSLHQFLANRGYAVLSVNFRASTGFGKSFLNAGIREWAGAMHDDLLDAVDFVVNKGIADPNKVAIMGGSYGGYATLVGLSFTPDVFACGVDIVGPSNLVTLIEAIPDYWASFKSQLYLHVGNPTNETDRADMLARSPVTKVDSITKPLLIGQGENDPRVPKAESDQIVEAMAARNQTVTYLNYPNEGHGFRHPANNLAFFAATEHFLNVCLGGRAQEFGDNDFAGSSVEVLHGVEYVPGLAEQLKASSAMAETEDEEGMVEIVEDGEGDEESEEGEGEGDASAMAETEDGAGEAGDEESEEAEGEASHEAEDGEDHDHDHDHEHSHEEEVVVEDPDLNEETSGVFLKSPLQPLLAVIGLMFVRWMA